MFADWTQHNSKKLWTTTRPTLQHCKKLWTTKRPTLQHNGTKLWTTRRPTLLHRWTLLRMLRGRGETRWCVYIRLQKINQKKCKLVMSVNMNTHQRWGAHTGHAHRYKLKTLHRWTLLRMRRIRRRRLWCVTTHNTQLQRE